jgi:hypothetical protein
MKKNTRPDPFIESIRPFVTNLIRSPRGKRPESVGTALLVSARDAHFIISAAHVIDEGRKLWFFPQKRDPRPISGEIALSRPIGQKMSADRLDIGVARLAGGPLPPYELWQSIDISGLRPLPFPRKEFSLAFAGHASSGVKVNPTIKHIDAKYIGLNGVVHVGPEVYEKMGFDPSSHLIMELDRAPIKTDQGTWQFPDPHGLSGTPVWSKDENGACVVGIITEYHKAEKVLVATDIRHVIPLIELAERNYTSNMAGLKEGELGPYA